MHQTKRARCLCKSYIKAQLPPITAQIHPIVRQGLAELSPVLPSGQKPPLERGLFVSKFQSASMGIFPRPFVRVTKTRIATASPAQISKTERRKTSMWTKISSSLHKYLQTEAFCNIKPFDLPVWGEAPEFSILISSKPENRDRSTIPVLWKLSAPEDFVCVCNKNTILNFQRRVLTIFLSTFGAKACPLAWLLRQ